MKVITLVAMLLTVTAIKEAHNARVYQQQRNVPSDRDISGYRVHHWENQGESGSYDPNAETTDEGRSGESDAAEYDGDAEGVSE